MHLVILISLCVSLNSIPAMISQEEMLSLVLIVVLLVLPSRTYGEILHVRPTSANTSCPTQPCHTLSEYAQNLEQYFNESNLKLQFLPGNPTLNVNLTITSIHQLEMLGNASAVVPTRIACSSNVGFAFRDTSDVKIDTLVFVSCARSYVTRAGDDYLTTYYGLHLRLVQRTEIIGCTFQDSYGSALGVVDSHVILRGSNSFLNNCRLCSNEGCYFRGLKCYGGGVSARRSNLNFTGKCIFGGNSAFSGGGIYSGSHSKLNLSGNTEFVDNSALYGGGVYSHSNNNIEISGNNTFIGNSVKDGGGVYAGFHSNINISGNAIFISNIARGDDMKVIFDSVGCGGGVYIRPNSSTNISGNTTFFGNSAGNNGGGVFFESANNVSICGNTAFISNSALNGGGVFLQHLNNVSISGNSKFIGNSAGMSGGGIHLWAGNIVDISGNTTFIYNLANRNGGGVHSWSVSSVWQLAGNFGNFHLIDKEIFDIPNSSVCISGNAAFIGNSAFGNGGGMYAVDSSSVIIGGNAIFRSNSAIHGGGGFFGKVR